MRSYQGPTFAGRLRRQKRLLRVLTGRGVLAVTLPVLDVLEKTIKIVARWVWLAEWIPLGPLAPHVLGLMFGSKPQRVEPDDQVDTL